MPTDDEITQKGTPVPYVSLLTLKGQVDRMISDGGAPAQIDRSYFSGLSSGYQSQITAAMRILGLIDPNGVPTASLRDLIDEPSLWPDFIKEQLLVLYPEIIAMAQARGTQKQLEDFFKEKFKVTGSTLRSAIKFYLDASNLAGLPVSPLFRVPLAGSNTERTRTGMKGKIAPISRIESPAPPAPSGSTYSVALNSGGSVILAVQVDIFSLSENDRSFVFGLVDQVKKYEASRESDRGEPQQKSAEN